MSHAWLTIHWSWQMSVLYRNRACRNFNQIFVVTLTSRCIFPRFFEQPKPKRSKSSFVSRAWVMPGSWKRKRIFSEGIDFKQLEKCDSGKVAKYSSSKDVWSQLVHEYYNLRYKPILSKVQRFQYLCKKPETKKCNASKHCP